MLDFRWLRDLWEGKRLLGRVVERATQVLTIGTTGLFTVSAGRILVTSIVGEITVVMQGFLTTLLLRAAPTLGTARNICAALDVNAYAAGDQLSITGVNTDAMLPPVSSSSIEGQTMPVLVKAGAISLVIGASNTGSIRWTLHYIPLDAAAAVAAA